MEGRFSSIENAMSDTTSNPNPSHWNALRKIVKRLPANLAYYGSALGAIVLAGGGQLPPGLEFVAGSIGGNMLSNMISEILKDEDLLDDKIRQRAEEAINKSDIANLLTKQDFLQGYARLIQRLDAQKNISQDILDELQTGFSTVATANQVEELKRLILQLMQQPPQVVTRKARLFISYARADDEPFVERLYHDLKDEFDIWWDRETMSNRGKTFLQEIRDAIDHADRLLLVAGPRAFASDYVHDEWQYAYETYKGINIALRLGDYTDFPAQLSGFDAPDFRSDADYDEQLATLKRQLAEPVAPIGGFHNVPALPPHFLNRPEALDALRELVIADVDKPTIISAEKRTTAVEGMGGIGKSALAAAFAHDRKVRFAFPDGIVWLTAGRDAKLYELYRAVGIALGDDLSNYPDETTARQNAQKALADKKCLLILDDVWELPVGRAFRDLISGTVARLLITTRNLQINDLLNANEYPLKLIDESQAMDYLRSWVGNDPKLGKIAEKLGYLFLALKLAGARMKKDKLSGADYLRTFDRVSRMKIDRNATDRDDSLEVSITLSVDAAFAGIEDDKLLYHTFGIFQEDTPIPQRTILQLWGYLHPDADEFDLLETLNALVDLALVERHEDRTITLHDLLHNYTREKLGSRYGQTHQDLVDSYQLEQWHQLLPDEPYMWKELVYHLMEARRYGDVLQIVDKPFLAAKIRHLKSYSSIFGDLRNAISAAEAVGNLNRMLGLALVYNGFQTKIVQLGSSEVIPLYARFGEVERALEFAKVIEDPNKQAETLVKLAREVRASDIGRARQLVQQVLKRWTQYEAGYTFGQILGQILEIFPDEIINFLEDVEEFTPIHSLGHSSFGIAYEQIDNLAPQLPIELQTRLVNVLIKNIALAKHEYLQAEIRSALARFISDPDIARTFAEDQVAQLIVSAKEHIAQKGNAALSPEFIEQTINLFFQEATQNEKDVLYRYIISPYFRDFYAFITASGSSVFALNTDERIRLLLDLIYRVIKVDADFDKAQQLLFEALDLNATLKGLDATITKNSHPGSFKTILEWIVEGLAAHNLLTALDFLKVPAITQVLHETEADRLPIRAIAAAARTQAHDALRIADGLGTRQKEWAKAFIAEGLAHTDLAQAISIWKELDANEIDKPEALIKILRNASLNDYLLAQTVLAEGFRPEQTKQVYKVPVLLDIAARCYTADPIKAQLIGEQVREILYRLDREKQGKVLKEFFILPLIRPMVLCGLFNLAWSWTRSISDDSGLEAVACAEILEVLSQYPALRSEATQQYIRILLSLVTDTRNHGRGHTGGFSDLILDFAENLRFKDDTNLISIYLQTYSGRHRRMLDWSPDYVKGIIAPQLALYDTDAAWRIIEEIRDAEFRIFAKVDLYNVLLLGDISNLSNLNDDGLLLAIAYIRVAKHISNPDEKLKAIETALVQANKCIPRSLDELGIRLVVRHKSI
jgi:hypothetical protein